MTSRVTLSLLTLISLAISTVLVASFAAIDMDEPVYAPVEEATSASETQSQQGVSKERSESNGNTQPTSTPPGTSSQGPERAPRSEDIEPLGEPMLASYFAHNFAAA